MSTTTDVTTERRQASSDLVATARQLMLAAATTDVDLGAIREAQQAIAAAAAVLSTRTRARALRADFNAPAAARAAGPGTAFSLFSYNPLGIPLDIYFDDEGAVATLTPNALHEGPHDAMHGGFMASLMDCMLGILIQSQGSRAVTATLTMNYRRRTPLDEPLTLRSRIVDHSGQKTIAEGWIEHDGMRTVEATGLFIHVPR
jgi:acyl-coenzyme A thioesterase PaaI-like protein